MTGKTVNKLRIVIQTYQVNFSFLSSAVFYTNNLISNEECAFASLLVAISCARELTGMEVGYTSGIGSSVQLKDFSVVIESVDQYIEVLLKISNCQ